MPLVARLLTLLLLSGGLLTGVAPAHAVLPSQSQWEADVRDAMSGSRAYLVRRAEAKKPGEKLAVNLDIDNTMLASGYAPGDAVGPTLAFAARARAEGMKVFVNTARIDTRRAETIDELQNAGYVVDGICLRKDGEATLTSKKRCRASFRARGFTLVANVGNSRTDFQGGGFEEAYRLPNYDGQLK